MSVVVSIIGAFSGGVIGTVAGDIATACGLDAAPDVSNDKGWKIMGAGVLLGALAGGSVGALIENIDVPTPQTSITSVPHKARSSFQPAVANHSVSSTLSGAITPVGKWAINGNPDVGFTTSATHQKTPNPCN